MTETTAIECAALVLALLFAVLAPRWARPLHARIMRVLGRIASRPLLACFALGALTTAFTAVHAYVVHWPEPSIHDEFAYLLGADTFAGGELTRPTHLFWKHFESYHILLKPSYAPKYPPGQSVFLAAGHLLTGEVRAGLWLQAGMMVSAVTWMLLGWMPRRWAILGGAMFAAQHGIVGPWVQTFFGGCVAAMGGALMLGAAVRLRKSASPQHAIILAVGLAILSVSRPYEGLVSSLPVAVFLIGEWLSSRDRARYVIRVYLPILVVLGYAGYGIAQHNEAVTGDPLQLPYAEYDERYSVYPPFLWQPCAPVPEYRHDVLEDFMLGFQEGDYDIERSPVPVARFAAGRIWNMLRGLLGGILIVPLLIPILLWAVRRLPRRFHGERSLTLPVTIVVVVGAAASATTFTASHYAAPAFGALAVLVMSGWRRVATLPRQVRRRSAALAIGLIVGISLYSGYRCSKRWIGGERYFGTVRAGIRDHLLERDGPDLVLVNALRTNSVHHEFVYNAADIDGSPIVWARELEPSANEDLQRYYGDRHVWRLTIKSIHGRAWKLEHVRDPIPVRAEEPAAGPIGAHTGPAQDADQAADVGVVGGAVAGPPADSSGRMVW